MTADAYVFACDVPGIQKVLPQEWRAKYPLFDNIYKLSAGPTPGGCLSLGFCSCTMLFLLSLFLQFAKEFGWPSNDFCIDLGRQQNDCYTQ